MPIHIDNHSHGASHGHSVNASDEGGSLFPRFADADLAGVTRHTEEAYQWVASFSDKGFREVIRDRDRPWGDYGERPR